VRFDARQNGGFNLWLKHVRTTEQLISKEIYAPMTYPRTSFWIDEANKKHKQSDEKNRYIDDMGVIVILF